jgi:hypothetical protein
MGLNNIQKIIKILVQVDNNLTDPKIPSILQVLKTLRVTRSIPVPNL